MNRCCPSIAVGGCETERRNYNHIFGHVRTRGDVIVSRPMTAGEKLKSQLQELSHNLWWAWNPHIIKLFRDLDADAFRAANHNPVSVLASFSPDRFEDLARDATLRARV